MKSQFGQAEWLLELCKALGLQNGHIFEAGASSPHSISNSRCFINEGWTATLVEALGEHCEEWEQLNLDNIKIYKKLIPYKYSGLNDTLDELCDSCPDVLFLDIDGSEYHQLKGLTDFRPKFICVEYDNSYPLNIEYVPRFMRHSVESTRSLLLHSNFSLKRLYLSKYIFLDHIL